MSWPHSRSCCCCRFRYQPHDSAYGEIHEYITYLDHEGMKVRWMDGVSVFACALVRFC